MVNYTSRRVMRARRDKAPDVCFMENDVIKPSRESERLRGWKTKSDFSYPKLRRINLGSDLHHGRSKLVHDCSGVSRAPSRAHDRNKKSIARVVALMDDERARNGGKEREKSDQI